jgi:hypothetical protein
VNTGGRLWITSQGDAGPGSGVPGLDSWTAGQIVTISDPNLTFEPGVSNGTFATGLDLDSFAADGDARIDAIHYVSTALTVGIVNTVDLQVGDVLLSTADSETFTGTTTLAVASKDVFIFRPTVAGDYTSGAFIFLMEGNVLSENELVGITLVEQTTQIGDISVQAGTFLFTQIGNIQSKFVYHWVPDSVGAALTSGTRTILLNCSDVGIIRNPMIGIELLEECRSIGGVNIPAGVLLITLEKDDTVGDNLLDVTEWDIFALAIVTTEPGSGLTSGDAVLLFEGADVGLNLSAENPGGLSLLPN